MAQDYFSIEGHILQHFSDKLGEYGPALYILAFNPRGNAVLFTKEGVEVQHNTNRERLFSELKDNYQNFEFSKLDSILVGVTDKFHVVQQTHETDDKGGDPPCGCHIIPTPGTGGLQVEVEMLRKRLTEKDDVIRDLRARLDAEAESGGAADGSAKK